VIVAVDIGNSRIKMGLFSGNELLEVLVFPHVGFESALTSLPKWNEIRNEARMLGICSVGREALASKVKHLFAWLPDSHRVDIGHTSKFPIRNNYRTPQSLGMDRLCVAVAAQAESPGFPILILDAGSAVTSEFVDHQGTYQGGTISPGLTMRFRALQAFTAKLPWVEAEGEHPLVGKDTPTAIRSGVVNGFVAELQALIDEHKMTHGSNLVVYLTGGDLPFLRNRLKNINFADAHLLLRGIHILTLHNAQTP